MLEYLSKLMSWSEKHINDFMDAVDKKMNKFFDYIIDTMDDIVDRYTKK